MIFISIRENISFPGYLIRKNILAEKAGENLRTAERDGDIGRSKVTRQESKDVSTRKTTKVTCNNVIQMVMSIYEIIINIKYIIIYN